jgi:hypothetical protein
MNSNLPKHGSIWLVVLLSMCVNPARGDSGIRVEALNCQFKIPNDYIVQIGDGSTEFYTPTPHQYGRISLRSLSDENAKPEATAKQMEQKTSGHLKVIRYVVPPVGGRKEFSYVVVKGLTEQLILTGSATQLADAIASDCMTTAPPGLADLAKRREAGCPTLARADLDAFFSQMRPQPVFRNGGIAGWRVYERGQQPVLPSLGLQSSDLITHVCGVPMSEIVEVSGDICCKTPVLSTVEISVERNGRSEKVVAQMPNKSLQPIAPKPAQAER